jgi:hypothetical protein
MGKISLATKVKPGGLSGNEVFDVIDSQNRLWKGSPEAVSEYVKTDLNIEPYKAVKTVKKTIGNRTVTGTDFVFVTAANTTEQIIDLGAIVPAYARILDVIVVTDAAFTNLGALSTDVGTSSGGGELIAAADNTALNALLQPVVGATFTLVAISGSAGHVYVNVTPTNNWNSATPVGKMSVYVTYIDRTNF